MAGNLVSNRNTCQPPARTASTVNGQRSTVNGTCRANWCRCASNQVGCSDLSFPSWPMQPHHRSLVAWVEAKEVSRAAFRAARDHWSPPASALLAQLQRSSLSIQLNIAEGFALADRGRFGNHLAVAYGSAVETEELLEFAVEEGVFPAE